MSSTAENFVTGIKGFFSDAAVLVDALKDAAIGMDLELLDSCLAGIHTDVLDDNSLLNGAVNTLLNILPDHLREWEGATDVIANLVAPYAENLKGEGALC